jgi:multidrug resistance efflux pump
MSATSHHPDEALPIEAALHAPTLLATPRRHRIARRVVLGLLAFSIAILFIPWQQYVQGKGVVMPLRPEDRPQQLNAVVGGRIVAWHVSEGEFVRAGDLLLTLAEAKQEYLDPETPARLEEQVDAKGASAAAKADKVLALDRQLVALSEAARLKDEQARTKVEQARLGVAVDSAAVEVAVVDSTIAGRQLAAQEGLFRDGLKSLVELEAARSRAQGALARTVLARNSLAKSRADLANAELDVAAVAADYADKIAKTRADRDATRAEVADAQAEVAKLRNTAGNVRERNLLLEVRAPRDGWVVRAVRAGVGEVLKEGEAIATIRPAEAPLAVALQVKAMDVPLLRPGRKVRLQFDGWPALQFAGWPSVAVGTFGGIIRVVDQVDSPDGSYRLLIVPDPADEPWPESPPLMVGSGVLGWAMLDTVPIWYELWRLLNGFPPSVSAPAPGGIPEAVQGGGGGK